MLYKEWRIIRIKFLIGTVIYIVGTSLFLFNRTDLVFEPRFHSWLAINLWAMFIAGIFAGADIVAEEKANSTLSFLLIRPMSRARIYATKLSMNMAAILTPFLLCSGWILWVDQTSSNPFNLRDSLIMSGLTVLLGIMTTCLSGMISIFARSTIDALLFSLVAVGILAGSLWGLQTFVVNLFYFDLNIFWQLTRDPSAILVATIWLTGLTIGFFQAGLHFFKTKEF